MPEKGQTYKKLPAPAEYEYTGNENGLKYGCEPSKEMLDDFDESGYLLIRNLFNENEVDKMVKSVEGCPKLWETIATLADQRQDVKHTYDFAHWSTPPGNDVMGLTVRTKKVAELAEKLLRRGEIYQYSNKILMKTQKGAAIEWHQDYGFYYYNRALYPDFIICSLALTKSDIENGGLQVARGSHKIGRIDHWQQSGVRLADPERVSMLLENKLIEALYCNQKAGDAVFFHANTLHKSLPNESTHRRWQMVLSFNAVHNSPDRKHYNAQFTKKLEYVPADAVEKCESLEMELDKDFVDFNDYPYEKPVTDKEKTHSG